MSKKGVGGGPGSISGRGGGSITPRNMMGGGVGGSNGGLNGGRYSHLKTLETDAKYGMLMWQSKLQEKLLKEQKEKKQKELSSLRRKSDEDYNRQTQPQSQRFGTIPLRGGRGSNYALRTTTPAKNNSNTEILTDFSHNSQHKVNFRNQNPHEFRIEISQEGDAGSLNPKLTPTQTQFTEVETLESNELRNLSEKFATSSSPDNNEAASNFAPSKYLGDVQTQTGAYDSPSNENFNNSREQGYNDEFRNKVVLENQYHDLVNNHEGGEGVGGSGGLVGGVTASSESYQYRHDLHPMTNNNMSNKANAILPKIGKGESRMPKLNNSVSYDNLSKPLNPPLQTLPNHYHHTYSQFQQDLQNNASSIPAAGLATPYNYSTNLAFFGLQGFGSGGVAGCSGAGAPRRSPSGRLLTNLQGHPEIRYHQKDTRNFDTTLRYMMDKDRILQYREDLDKQVLENEKQRARIGRGSMSFPIKIMSSHESNSNNQDDADLGENGTKSSNNNGRISGPGMELAPLIRKYKSLPKLNTHKSSSDVTKQFVASPRRGDNSNSYPLSPEPEEVAKGLLNQLQEKQKMIQITQENDRLASEKHFNTWDSWWGRPGCGAPMVYFKNSRVGASTPSLATSRTDLFKALHMTHQKK